MLNFFSYTFVFFLLTTLICYYLVPKKFQWICVLIANIVFYACTGAVNFIFILLSSLVTFGGARIVDTFSDSLKSKKTVLPKEDYKIEKEKNKAKKRWILFFVLLINVGVLAYLKYWNVIIISLSKTWNCNLDFLFFSGHKTLLLPLGISFYTFQTIAYFMDIYNCKDESEKNFFRYFLFVSFFPQLIMGPINRYNKLGKELKEVHNFKFENVKQGVILILYGAMKKYCIADMLFNRIASVLDHNYTTIPGSLILISILMYSVYQYADFSGGIDMVLGFAKLFDLNMQPNFRQPYFATSLGDFWRRWHISLGLWMKDYIFYPCALTKTMQNLGKWCGNHWGKHFSRVIPAGIANILVFLIVGIWHGPEMHFVIWGLYNGLIIAFSDLFKPAFEKLSELLHINTKSTGFHLFRIIRTFAIVNIGWYFDRIVDVPKSFLYLKRTFFNFNLNILGNRAYLKDIFGSSRDTESQFTLIFICCIIVFIISVLKERGHDVYANIQKKNIAIRWGTYYVLLILVILSTSFAPGNPVFMYAQY